MLAAREQRAERQRQLLARFGRPLISFTMNIPGPIKNSGLIGRSFQVGLERLGEAMAAAGLTALDPQRIEGRTGCEFLCAVAGDSGRIKAICEAIEDGGPLGRLFDMDVLDETGRKLSRQEERRCLVCGAPGKGCASRRLHSLELLERAARARMTQGLLEADRARIGALATQALLDEVNTTPKPGLVDRNNTGAHRDMDLETFYRSAEALSAYWPACFRLGVETASAAPAETFARLRQLGRAAEERMLEATGGVNTHKGAVFTLGTVCGAVGRLWSAEAPCRDPERICAACAAMSRSAVEADFRAMGERGPGSAFGEQAFVRYGLRGARGELAEGLPAVLTVGLPRLEEALGRGMDLNAAAAVTLLHLAARGSDTNLIRRGGLEVAQEAVKTLGALLAKTPFPDLAAIGALDDWFIERNLSPGGSADLLAVTLFFHRWQRAR